MKVPYFESFAAMKQGSTNIPEKMATATRWFLSPCSNVKPAIASWMTFCSLWSDSHALISLDGEISCPL